MITKEEASKRALEFLGTHETGTLATASLDGKPYASTVYFEFLPDFTILFSTSHHTAKFRNITLNDKVAFSVGTGPEYRELVIHGSAQMISDVDECKETLAAIERRITSPPENWPIHAIKSLSEGGTSVFRVTPEEVLYLDLTAKDQYDSASKYFYQLFP